MRCDRGSEGTHPTSSVWKFFGRLWFVGCVAVGLLTGLSVFAAFFQQTSIAIGKNGFFGRVPPDDVWLCFKEHPFWWRSFPQHFSSIRYYNQSFAFLGVCTNASMYDVDSIFGSKNRMLVNRASRYFGKATQLLKAILLFAGTIVAWIFSTHFSQG